MKDGFWKINAFRPEIKAIKGKTRKFNFGLKSKLGRIGEPMEEFPFFLYIKAVWGIEGKWGYELETTDLRTKYRRCRALVDELDHISFDS